MAGMTEHALIDTAHAFDGVASAYDRSNTENPILCAMRERVLAAVMRQAPAGARILDLGCGPGADAEVLARQGYQVTAVDWSRGMVEEASRRAAHAGVADRCAVYHLGIQQLDHLPAGVFDVAYSNFGPLNCVPDLRDAARQIASRIRPGGALVASVIGRVCPWEIALFGLRADWARLSVRYARDAVAVPLNGRTVWMRYYSPAEFEAACVPAGFARASLVALGLFAPPPYLQGFAGRHPRLHRVLHRLDAAAGAWPGLRHWGDHFLMVLRKA